MWILQSSEGTFRLTPGAVKTIGRASAADFIVDVALVSRVHCRLTATDGHVEVQDLSSTNGTFVNDRKIDRANLASGDRLRVGRVEITVERKNND
jgi:pSer/pThr/pTyr-binding forkhead associated (FHA) protein